MNEANKTLLSEKIKDKLDEFCNKQLKNIVFPMCSTILHDHKDADPEKRRIFKDEITRMRNENGKEDPLNQLLADISEKSKWVQDQRRIRSANIKELCSNTIKMNEITERMESLISQEQTEVDKAKQELATIQIQIAFLESMPNI
ncbi:hypothetical protein Ciccas_003448 [Cichlidogyrus casuarinus]|uniref:Uncharacterized protein n=1 Tax=Cichlidogyrus casuarinus TaxID=1844966 RepID=A0ABD2QEC1_9PLAT